MSLPPFQNRPSGLDPRTLERSPLKKMTVRGYFAWPAWGNDETSNARTVYPVKLLKDRSRAFEGVWVGGSFRMNLLCM